MANRKTNCKTNSELEKAILVEKTKGTPDIEIGNKYRVTLDRCYREFKKMSSRPWSAPNIL